MSDLDIVIVASGGANIASLQFALERLEVAAEVSSDPRRIRDASHVILPGVGAALDAMTRLRSSALDSLIPSLTQPVLGICLGMQLLHESSAEGPTECLGVIPGATVRLADAPGRPVPHMGWNTLDIERPSPLLEGLGAHEHAYFVHSYAVLESCATIARCRYGAPFSACVAWRNFYGVQFHPERSAAAGARVLRNFHRPSLKRTRDASAPRHRLEGRPLRTPVARRLRAGDGVFDGAARACAQVRGDGRGLAACRRPRRRARRPRRSGNRALIAQLAGASRLKLQVGGGLRTRADVQRVLDAGAARAVVGSAALSDPAAVRGWIEDFGSERIALAFDVRLDADGTPCIATHGWQRQSSCPLWEALAAFSNSPLAHVLCTDVAQDGALSGPNVALYAEAARRFPGIAWQASGGIRDAADLKALAACGAAAAISGKALLEELIPVEELRPFLPNA